MKAPYGIMQPAFDAFLWAAGQTGIDVQARDDFYLTQTIGNAAASAKFHYKDGEYQGRPYCAAVDISVRGLTKTQIATFLENLCRAGFIAFYRNWPGNLHIHAIYAGAPSKEQLDRQNEDFFAGRDGLVGHRRIDDEWWFPSIELRRIPEAMFRISNGANPRVVTSPALEIPAIVQKPAPQSIAFYLNAERKPRFWMPVIDGVSLAPVRAFGGALGLDVEYLPKSKSIVFDHQDQPIAVTNIAGVGHAPVAQLVREVGLKMTRDLANHKVTVTR